MSALPFTLAPEFCARPSTLESAMTYEDRERARLDREIEQSNTLAALIGAAWIAFWLGFFIARAIYL